MSTDLVPVADVAALEALAPDRREDQVTLYLSHARDELARAVELSGPATVAALKARIATAADATRHLGLSKEIQADAQEMVRRAEYALGKAIRTGQECGEIRTQQHSAGGARQDYERGGQTVHVVDRDAEDTSISPTGFFTSTKERSDVYDMVDNVTAPEFDAAIEDAKAEGNLSRANVVRKIKGVKAEGLTPVEKLTKIRDLAPTGASSHQIAREIGVSPEYVRDRARHHDIEIIADKVMGRVKRIDSNRIVQETVTTLEGLTSGIKLVVLDDLDPDEIEHWAASLTDSIRALNRLTKQIKEMTQ